MLEVNKIYWGDCFHFFKEIEDKSIDLILCDLPYGLFSSLKWDVKIDMCKLWLEYKRVLKDGRAIILFATQPFATYLINSNIEMFKYEWIWKKSNAGDAMNVKNKPMRLHENILVFSNGTVANKSNKRMIYYPQGLVECSKSRKGADYSQIEHTFKSPRPSHKPYIQQYTNYPTSILSFKNDKPALHPTQKPLLLNEYLIKTYSNEGDVVLDNCAGSCTVAIAAKNTNRNWICIEKEEKYYQIGLKRLNNHDQL